MTREREDDLLAELNALQLRAGAAIQRIVDARRSGTRDDIAIADLADISRRRRTLTTPSFDQSAG